MSEVPLCVWGQVELMAAAEPRGNNLKGLDDFHLQLQKARSGSGFRTSDLALKERPFFKKNVAEQSAPAPHRAHPEGCAALRIVLVTVPRVSRSCEHFPDGSGSGLSNRSTGLRVEGEGTWNLSEVLRVLDDLC